MKRKRLSGFIMGQTDDDEHDELVRRLCEEARCCISVSLGLIWVIDVSV